MTKALFIRQLDGSLDPADGEAWEVVHAIPAGKEVWAEIKRARNPRRHRLFWALVKICQENTETTLSKDAWADYLKILAGHCEIVQRKGETIKLPKSIAWSKMDEGEFSAFLTALMNVICTEIIPGLPPGDLRAELEAITEIKTEAH